MNKAFTIILFSILSFTAKLQTTYLASDYADISDSIHLSTASVTFDTFNFIETGENMYWNFAELPVDDQIDKKFIDPTISR